MHPGAWAPLRINANSVAGVADNRNAGSRFVICDLSLILQKILRIDDGASASRGAGGLGLSIDPVT
jgi:hypothetical protein